jgi:hypothetical protein
MTPFKAMILGSFIGGYAGGLLALSMVEKVLDDKLQQLMHPSLISYIDDIELQ